MSCPQCGSGAVYKGKCRECGFEVKIHRVTGVNPPVGHVPKYAEATHASRNPGKASEQRPSAERLAGVSPAPWMLGEGDEDESTTADPTVSGSMRGLRPPSTPARAAPLAAGGAGGPAPDERASWYAAAGLAVPQPDLIFGGSTARVSMAGVGRSGLPAAFAAGGQALASMAGIFLGHGIWSGLGGMLQAVLAVLLVCRIPIARALIPAVVAWDLGWAVYLGATHDRLLAPFAVLPAVFLLVAFYASRRSVRWVGAVLGAALSLIGMVTPSFRASREGAVAGGFAPVAPSTTPRSGFRLRSVSTLPPRTCAALARVCAAGDGTCCRIRASPLRHIREPRPHPW